MAATAKKASRRGRRLLLTPKLQRNICAAIEAGALYKSAAQANGISYDTFMEWMQRGRGEGNRSKRGIFAQFARAVEKAQGKSRVLVEAAVRKQNGPWYLTHHPEMKKDWGEEQGQNGTRVSVIVELADAAAARIATLDEERIKQVDYITNGKQ